VGLETGAEHTVRAGHNHSAACGTMGVALSVLTSRWSVVGTIVLTQASSILLTLALTVSIVHSY